ncbi:thiolase family protein [Protofrankia symbiont of Coriaria myrtifolia]|uniref:thiolase family protein n=1 Tax=Protofrankia symbiont of Coriaria myrtifolia TaxID=1306540 RepID=UPI0010410852|nr:thiolase family protein [Protofrankia symbiont of Coriaria myrtifolia]
MLAAEACRAAVSDAGLSRADIDGVCVYGGSSGLPGLSAGGVRGVEQALGLRPVWHCGARDVPGRMGPIVSAMLAVSAGLCRHVLCLAVPGGGGSRAGTWPAPTADGSQRGRSAEASSSLRRVALAASEYLTTFGHGREALGWVAVAARRHAARNCDALCRTPLAMDRYLAARMVASPLGRFDCAVPCDAAVALVVSATDVCGHLPHPPVWIDAVGTRRLAAEETDLGLAGYRLAAEAPAAHLWSRASVVRQDVDFVALDDTSTFDALCWLEALGFCAPGEAAEFVRDGTRIGPGGVLPLNPHGGELAAGRSDGYGGLYEAVLQLRGEAEERQIPNARAAVVSSGAAGPGAAMVLVSDSHPSTTRSWTRN